jgi:hypothetical protein
VLRGELWVSLNLRLEPIHVVHKQVPELGVEP